jgi:hypothetical protein
MSSPGPDIVTITDLAVVADQDDTVVVERAPDVVQVGYAQLGGRDGHTPDLYSGAAAPTIVHADGDLYLDTGSSPGDLYQQDDGTWVLKGNLQGPAGPAGPTGPTGPPGTAMELTFNVAVPAAVWEFTHPFPLLPNVITTDTSGARIEGDVSYPTPDSVRIEWAFPMAGTAVLTT